MKLQIMALLFLTALAFPSSSSAAFIVCEYQAQACNAEGDHYYCEVVGWIVADPFCSPKDESTFPTLDQKFCGERRDGDCSCMETCNRRCSTPPAFCGQW